MKLFFKILSFIVINILSSTIAQSISFQSPFSVITSSIVLSDTSSSFYLANGSNVKGWKGGSIVRAVDEERNVDYRDQTILNVLDYLRLPKEFLFSAKDDLNSFNLAGVIVFDRAWGGEIDLVAVGSCANVWAVKGDKFYMIDIDGETQIDGQNFPWIELGPAVAKISAGRDNTIWGVGGIYGGLTPGRVYSWDGSAWQAKELPTGIDEFTRLSVGDQNNIWAFGVDYSASTTTVYKWHNDTASWLNKNIGALAPDKAISAGGDGLLDIIILGVKADGAGDKLVIWEESSSSWQEVSLGLSGHEILEVSVGQRNNIGLIIKPAGSSESHFYKLENLSTSGPYSGTIDRVREIVSRVEMGYYGDGWFYDPYENYWYRLVGGVIRSVVNYVADMPNIKRFTAGRTVLDGLEKDEGITPYDGITINPGATLEVTSGLMGGMLSPISLNGGTLSLKSDFHFSSTTYMVTGGSIKGNGYAIFLGNDFLIPANQSLRFTATTVIEGQGHCLILGNNAQLIVDSKVTLSLRNLILKGLQDSTNSIIIMLANDSEISFQNVELACSGDYTFTQGYFLITDDLYITGTSKLIYESSQPCYVNEHSTFYFDIGTTFSYVPLSGARNLLNMKDITSVLYLNGCTLQAPGNTVNNGLVLTKGILVFENNVILENLNNGAPNSNINKAVSLGDGVNASSDLNVLVLSDAMVCLRGYLDYDPS